MRPIAFIAALALLAPAAAHADEEQPTRARSVPLAVGGIVVAGAGATSATIGGIFFVLDAVIKRPVPQLACPSGGPCPTFNNSGPSGTAIMGGIFLGAGAAALAVSIPMMVVGASRVQVSPSGPSGSTGATLRMTF
jgi:hypothetical protein